MKLEDPAEEQRRFKVAGVVMGLVVVAAGGALAATLVMRSGSMPQAPPATPTEAAGAPQPGRPRLAGPAELRSAPASDAAIVTRLAAADALRLVGRSPDNQWLAVALVERPEVIGWVASTVVLDADVGGLPVVAGPGGSRTPPPGAVTQTPDLPDLVVDEVYAEGNALHVSVLNQGAGDYQGGLRVAIDDGEPVDLDVKGVPLHPGQWVEARVPDEWVQLRSRMTVEVFGEEGRDEEDAANNLWEGVVEPDLPNDIEVLDARIEEGTHLVVTVRNNSPMPVSGEFTISVREALPSTTLLGRHSETRTLQPEETVDVPFPEVGAAGLPQVTITISTTAIDDANLANDSFPR